MNKQQFKNLNLFTIQFPITAIISILHRLSGIFVFLLIPFLLWLLDIATRSTEGFDRILNIVTMPITKFIVWLFLAALGYHLIAGVRHLLMDIGWGEGLKSARWTAKITLGLSIVWAILIGIWLW